MKISFLASDLALPGQGFQLAQLAAAAKEDGHEVGVISLGSSGAAGVWLAEKDVPVRTLPSASWRMPMALARFSIATLLSRPDILQTWGLKANIAGKSLGFFCGAKAIVSSLRSPETPKRMEVERVSSFLCAKTVANSEWLASLALNCGVSKSQVAVIPNAFDASAITRKERRKPAKDGKWKILFVGRRSPNSGVPVMVSALAGLAKSGMPFKAIFAGDAEKGFDAEMQLHLDAQGISTKMDIRGALSQEALRKLMEDSHLLIAPNIFNWTPNTILEAFASGLPVVATNIEGVKELVVDGKTGHLAIPLDPTSLAKKIAESVMDYDGTIRMAREAHKTLRERHNPKDIHTAYLDLYKSLALPVQTADAGRR